MADYEFESVRWLKARARLARAMRNFPDENAYYQIAREIEELRAENQKLKEDRHDLG